MTNAWLTLTDLSCERDDRWLFQAFNWQATGGQLWQLSGANGSGKTSLLKILAGLLNSDHGRVEWRLGEGDWREHLGYVGHQSGLRDELSAEENLAWLAALHGERTENVQSVLADLGLGGFTDLPLAHLSVGQRRRVALARLWLSDKQVWLLDEPFTAIDAKGVALLEARLVQLVQAGKLVIYTSHHQVSEQARRIELAHGQLKVVA